MEVKPVDADIWEVEFKARRIGYYYNCNDVEFDPREFVIVAAERGEDIGLALWKLPGQQKLKGSPKAIIRIASENDMERLGENRQREEEALDECLGLVKKHSLDMKLVDAEYQLDGNKLTFYFTADQRVDFRELVKDLAAVYKTRIELRQIGVRDEAKRRDGFGICGLRQCCSQWLREFEPISTQLAREQNLSLNPQKISGNCGRLLCCLRYEQSHYQETLGRFPSQGTRYTTDDGEGVVEKINVFDQAMTVRLDGADTQIVKLKDVERKRRQRTAVSSAVGNSDNNNENDE
jgi:cell fate regulator YaaT (PSP1 superfamily)